MAKRDSRSVDEYIAAQPEAARRVLQQVRRAIRTAVPVADESISYKIPTYKLNGAPVLYFAGWKRHYSLYPVNERILEAIRDEQAPYEIEKSTIRFDLSKPVPVKLIKRIAKLRVKLGIEGVKGVRS